MCGIEQSDPLELLAAARRDSDDSLGRLLSIYVNYLKLMATTQIDERLKARISPSDVVQESLLEAHRDFPQFRGQTEPELMAWLRKILANNLARLIEKHVLAQKRDVRREVSIQRIGAALERSTARLGAVLVDGGASPSAAAQRRESSVILADELAALSPQHRQVIILRHVEGLSFSEVAGRMERSEGAVRMLWLRAIEQLRRSLAERGMA